MSRFVVNTFDVTIQLERLRCVKEYDAHGHSEPYLWSAFLRADNTTIAGPSAPLLDVQVPLELQTGRGQFGDAGKSVKPGDVLDIPESLGRFETTLHSHRSASIAMGSEIMLAGFVAVLLEEDSTPSNAIKAGHKELRPALRDEIILSFGENERFPNAKDIEEIKEKVSKRVKDAIRDKVGCWSGFWSGQDDLIGVAGDNDTLFTAGEIRDLSGSGQVARQTSIHGTESVLQRLRPFDPFSPLVRVEVEHHYELFWNITVEAVQPPALTVVQNIEDTGTKLEQLDVAIEGLANKLRSADDQLGTACQVELEEKVKGVRPKLVRELEVAWAEFARAQLDNRAGRVKSNPK